MDTVDGRNPANQLRLVVYPMIYKILAPSQVVVWISSINSIIWIQVDPPALDLMMWKCAPEDWYLFLVFG